ncbi:MAG: hypothetical protein IH934_05905 [Nanoarchaeota archaeon]|nr:hypothetical protein [Nanoarchaeota archaeon]
MVTVQNNTNLIDPLTILVNKDEFFNRSTLERYVGLGKEGLMRDIQQHPIEYDIGPYQKNDRVVLGPYYHSNYRVLAAVRLGLQSVPGEQKRNSSQYEWNLIPLANLPETSILPEAEYDIESKIKLCIAGYRVKFGTKKFIILLS